MTFPANKFSFEPSDKKFETLNTVFKHIDNIWSSHLSDMIDYGIKNNRGYRYILVVKDSFSRYGFDVPLKNKAA